MKRARIAASGLTLVGAVALLLAPSVAAQSTRPTPYQLETQIPVPGWDSFDSSQISVDISWLDPDFGLFVIGDRTLGAIQTFDTNGHAFVGAAGAGAFVGPGPTGSAGPNGVTVVGANEVAGGDGDSTLKIVNLDSGDVQSVSTGGMHRVDEMAYDAASDTLVAANDREGGAANFITVFRAHPLTIAGKIPCPQCSGGIEQPVVVNGRFFIAFPATTANPKGEIDRINTDTFRLDQVIQAGECGPTGLAAGINGLFVTGGGGCVIDPTTGSVVQIADAGGDEIGTLPGRGIYAFVISATYTLNLADATTNQVYQKLPVALGHNLATNPNNGEIWVPDYESKSVLVFGPATSLQSDGSN